MISPALVDDRVGTAVETDDDDVGEAGGSQRRHGPERHRVVAGNHALQMAIGLNDVSIF